MSKPFLKPRYPYFSSGPCKKFPGWSYEKLQAAAIQRSHRHSIGYSKLIPAIDRTHKLLGMPADYKLAIVPASATGAIEIAMWNLLGARGVDALSFDVFSKRWANDITRQLRLKDARVFESPSGELPDLALVDTDRDVVFTWNATTTGVAMPHDHWIKEERQGLTICDATSAAFAYDLPWSKLDAVAFSWQKVMGGEAAHGMLALSPRALGRLNAYLPEWPIPFLYCLRKDSHELGKPGPLNEALFRGETLNTPSMLCVEDWLLALEWGERLGGLPALIKRTAENAKIMIEWADYSPWLANLAHAPLTQSKTSVCLKLTDPKLQKRSKEERWDVIKKICKTLEAENVAYDIKGHALADPCLRIWCGPTVEKNDLEALIPWLEWAYKENG